MPNSLLYFCKMFSTQGERWIAMLRWPSILLVTLLLSLFLYKSFQNEKERLQKEVGIVFVNTIKNIESNFINQLVMDSMRSDFFFNMPKKPNARMEQRKIISFMGSDSTDVHKLDARNSSRYKFSPNHNSNDSVKIVFNTETRIHQPVTENTLTQSKGVISIIMRTSDSSMTNEFSYQWTKDSLINQKIIKSFDKNLAMAGLNIQYDFLQMHDSLSDPASKKAAGFYRDMASGQNYIIQLTNPNTAAIRTIWLELVLATLLISILAFAFYTMQKTITHEQALMSVKNDFIQNMTHELKTPIATVQVAIEALHEYDGLNDISKRDEYLNISRQELDRLSFMVDRVLSLTKMDKALPPPIKEKIVLLPLVTQIADTFKIQIEKHRMQIHIYGEESDSLIHADKQWVAGIVYNLIDNAIKYSAKEGGQIEIYIQKEDHYIKLKVSDNGPGISEEHHDRIFEKFYRVPQGNIHTVKGHGLGLAFVKRLVQEMGGSIQLISAPGKGSSFNILLPV